MKERIIYIMEFTAIALLWTLVVVAPMLFIGDNPHKWHIIHVIWIECAIVGFAFIINRFILMPRLFFAKRYYQYILALVALLLCIGIFVIYLDGVNAILSLFGEVWAPPAPPKRPLYSVPITHTIPPTITVMILTTITIALDIGLRIMVKWITTEHKQSSIERERVMTQLQNLQSQVSPHFFMNTLNNIHALVDIDSERAKQTIIELSELMDYLLYGSSNSESVPLQKELDFLNRYINLMRLRFSKQVKIEFSHSYNIPHINIPPLLFLNLIENTFKHGVDYDKESFVKIHLLFNENSVTMTTTNSNHSKSENRGRKGIGISNSRQRLDLLYGNRYTLDIEDIDSIYYVTLKIPIL